MASATLRLILLGLTAALAGAAAVALTGLASGAREFLDLGARPPIDRSAEFADVYLRNASLAMAATVAAVPGLSACWRTLVSLALALLFVANAALVGAAAGAYGGVLGPHMALELVGFAAAGAPLVRRRAERASWRRLVGAGVGSLLVLAAAALLEASAV